MACKVDAETKIKFRDSTRLFQTNEEVNDHCVEKLKQFNKPIFRLDAEHTCGYKPKQGDRQQRVRRLVASALPHSWMPAVST